MKKRLLKLTFILVAVLAVTFCLQFDELFSKSKSLLLPGNLEALASPEGGGSYQNGPQKKYDCPGWFTGSGYRCAAEIKTNCSPIPCR